MQTYSARCFSHVAIGRCSFIRSRCNLPDLALNNRLAVSAGLATRKARNTDNLWAGLRQCYDIAPESDVLARTGVIGATSYRR